MNTHGTGKRTAVVLVVIAVLGGLVVWGKAAREPGRAGMSGAPASVPSVAVEIADGDTFELRATPITHRIGGVDNAMMAYNGSIPGPILRVRQGSTIKVRFTNGLAEPTTVHWHGIRVTNENDGVPHVTQEPVAPGETFTYELRFPDPGAYWYHPHVREDKQQDLGLYGGIIVTPSDPTYWPAAAQEESIMIDDILASRGFIAPYFDDLVDHALMGRYGNVMLLNGTEQPQFTATAGAATRYYLTNVANARPFNIVIPGAELTWLGSDGGRSESARQVGSVLLGSSERAVVQAVFPKPGVYAIEHRTPSRTYQLGTVEVSGAAGAAALTAMPTNDDFDVIRGQLDRPVDLTWRLDVETTHMMHHADGSDDIEWEDNMGMMNAHMTDATTRWKIIDAATGKENMDIDVRWQTGDYAKIRIVNDASTDHPMSHPIHLHGQRFVVAAVDGVPSRQLEWKDTVLVPKGAVTDIVVEISNPGEWMAHCHIAEHLQSGMMTGIMVEGADEVR